MKLVNLIFKRLAVMTLGIENQELFSNRINDFFQHENVDKVVFEGFKDEEEERILEIYQE